MRSYPSVVAYAAFLLFAWGEAPAESTGLPLPPKDVLSQIHQIIRAAEPEYIPQLSVLLAQHRGEFDINAGNAEGQTALMTAAGCADPVAIDVLLSNGARVFRKGAGASGDTLIGDRYGNNVFHYLFGSSWSGCGTGGRYPWSDGGIKEAFGLLWAKLKGFVPPQHTVEIPAASGGIDRRPFPLHPLNVASADARPAGFGGGRKGDHGATPWMMLAWRGVPWVLRDVLQDAGMHAIDMDVRTGGGRSPLMLSLAGALSAGEPHDYDENAGLSAVFLAEKGAYVDGYGPEGKYELTVVARELIEKLHREPDRFDAQLTAEVVRSVLKKGLFHHPDSWLSLGTALLCERNVQDDPEDEFLAWVFEGFKHPRRVANGESTVAMNDGIFHLALNAMLQCAPRTLAKIGEFVPDPNRSVLILWQGKAKVWSSFADWVGERLRTDTQNTGDFIQKGCGEATYRVFVDYYHGLKAAR